MCINFMPYIFMPYITKQFDKYNNIEFGTAFGGGLAWSS
jgi:hypothetical protein